MAFSFVDRIVQFEPGRSASGTFRVPVEVPKMPDSLVVEAVGQLAAWVAMEKCGFRARPVAALASCVDFTSQTGADRLIELRVELDSCEDDVVSYCGSAQTDNRDLVVLSGCVAPMLPIEQFDDPADVSRRFQILVNGKSESRGFVWAGRIEPHMTGGGNGTNRMVGELQIPSSAPFFVEHFPRKPVFPATLLQDAQIALGWQLASAVLQGKVQGALGVDKVRDMKARSFISPGELVTLECVVKEISDRGVEVALSAKIGSKVVATSVADFAVKEPD